MEFNELDKILEAQELVKGLLDIMYAMQTAEQDKLLPITILNPFGTVLMRISILLAEIEKMAGQEQK